MLFFISYTILPLRIIWILWCLCINGLLLLLPFPRDYLFEVSLVAIFYCHIYIIDEVEVVVEWLVILVAYHAHPHLNCIGSFVADLWLWLYASYVARGGVRCKSGHTLHSYALMFEFGAAYVVVPWMVWSDVFMLHYTLHWCSWHEGPIYGLHRFICIYGSW
jgi:hypothetical protein